MVSNSTDRFNGVVASKAIKVSCAVATSAPITLAGSQNIDGVLVTTGDRVLVRAQANPVDNGVYDVKANDWTRAADWDGNRDIQRGTLVGVYNSSGNFTLYEVVSTTDPLRPGTDAVNIEVWSQGSGAAVETGTITNAMLRWDGIDTYRETDRIRATAQGANFQIYDATLTEFMDVTYVGSSVIFTLNNGSHTFEFQEDVSITTGADLLMVGGNVRLQDADEVQFGTTPEIGIRFDGNQTLEFYDISGTNTGVQVGPGINNFFLNPEANASAALVIGEQLTPRGDNQQAFLNLYGEDSGVIAATLISNRGNLFWIDSVPPVRIDSGPTDNLEIEFNVASLKISEQTAPVADEAGYGQLWVRDDAPNVLVFRDDTGVDTDLGAGLGFGVSSTQTASPPTQDEGYLVFNTTGTVNERQPQMQLSALNTVSVHYFAQTEAGPDGFYLRTRGNLGTNTHSWGHSDAGADVDIFRITETDLLEYDSPNTGFGFDEVATVSQLASVPAVTDQQTLVGVGTTLTATSFLNHDNQNVINIVDQFAETHTWTYNSGGGAALVFTSSNIADVRFPQEISIAEGGAGSGVFGILYTGNLVELSVNEASTPLRLGDTTTPFQRVELPQGTPLRFNESGGVEPMDMSNTGQHVLMNFSAATRGLRLQTSASIYLEERAAANASVGGDGQLWVRNDTPNVLVFTDDAGTDFVLGTGLQAADNAVITGNWTFAVETIGDLIIDRTNATGASGLGFSNDDGIKGYIGFADDESFNVYNASTVSLLALDNAGNLQIDGDITTALGSAANPSHSFFNDDDSGMYSSGGTLGFSANTALVFQMGPALVRSYQHLWASDGLSVQGTVNDQGQAGVFGFVDTSGGVARFGGFDYDGPNTWEPVLVQGGATLTLNANDATGITSLQTAGVTRLQIDGVNSRTVFNDFPLFIEERGAAAADVAGYGQLWVRNDAPNVLMFTGDDGVDHQLTPPASGSVSVSGTPVNNQLAIWTNASTIEGDADLTYDGSSVLALNASVPSLQLQGTNGLADTQFYIEGPSVGASMLLAHSGGGLTINQTDGAQGQEDIWISMVRNGGVQLRFNNIAAIATISGGVQVDDSIYIFEKSAANVDSGGFGQLWVRDDTPNVLVFTDDAGNDTVLGAGGGGIGGTITNDQVAFGAATADEIEGSADFTFDGTTVTIADTAHLRLEELADVTLASTDHAFQIGLSSGNNIAMDSNEILSRNNGAAATLGMQAEGGNINMFTNTAGVVAVRSGSTLRIESASNGDEVDFSHDDTDFNAAFTDTTDWNITGITRLKHNGVLALQERASAPSDEAAYGQLWVRNDVPNTLMFTDDAGNDIVLASGGSQGGIESDSNTGSTTLSGTGFVGVLNLSLPINSEFMLYVLFEIEAPAADDGKIQFVLNNGTVLSGLVMESETDTNLPIFGNSAAVITNTVVIPTDGGTGQGSGTMCAIIAHVRTGGTPFTFSLRAAKNADTGGNGFFRIFSAMQSIVVN